MKKYTVVIHEKSGKLHKPIDADKIVFNENIGGVDIYIDKDGIPVMPCLEKDVYRFFIYINN